MKQRLNTTQAFTLTEVIVGLVVVTIIGVASWSAVNVLSPASQATTLRIKSEHLITLSQEELHQYAQEFQTVNGQISYYFDTNLSNCNFEQPPEVPVNPCGFADVSSQFSPFTRTLIPILDGEPSGIKKFDIHLTWQESGKTKVLDSVILLVHPSGLLPGNICGVVTDSSTGKPIPGASIVATNVSTPNTDTVISQNSITVSADNHPENYTFIPSGTDYYILPGGTWQITATANGYNPYTDPQYIEINKNEVPVDFSMVPQIKPATITANLVGPSGPLYFSDNSSTINLYENGSPAPNVSPQTTFYGGGSATFTVNFNDSNPRCFTLFTMYAYRSRLDGQFTWNGFSDQANGWSSAAANVLTPAQAWTGNADGSGDKAICVSPNTSTAVSIPLYPVPTAVAKVTVKDNTSTHSPINATSSDPLYFTVNWHDGTLYYNYNNTGYVFTSNDGTDGEYEVTVPNEADLFPPGDDAQVSANYNVPLYACCNNTGTSWQGSNPMSVVPPGLTATLYINSAAITVYCGNANLAVFDDSSPANAALGGAVVTLGGVAPFPHTEYTFECSEAAPPPYSIASGNEYLQVAESGYYSFPGNNNQYYTTPTSNPNIAANSLNTLASVGLWPIGNSSVSGTVVVQTKSGNIPAVGVTVVLNLSSGGVQSQKTGSDGTFSFPSVQETWPPSGCSICGGYATNYTLTVPASSIYGAGAYSGNPFPLTANKPLAGITIVLTANGGT